MTPTVPSVLAELAALVARNALPDTPPAERTNALNLTAALLGVAAEVWDGQAASLVTENRALRALLGIAGEDADLRISALKATNDGLRAKLIKSHAAAEQAGDSARQEAIWAELVQSTERRRLSTAPV
jgi:hypothetical protein